MKNKQFFKITNEKTILTIVLGLITLFLHFNYGINFLYWFLEFPLIISGFIIFYFIVTPNTFGFVSLVLYAFSLVLEIAYLYLLSCLATWIFKKVIKK